MRQIAGAFAEYEKARLVSKLRHARERVRQEKGSLDFNCARFIPWLKLQVARIGRGTPFIERGRRMGLAKQQSALVTSHRVPQRGK